MDVESWLDAAGDSLAADATVGAVVTLALSFLPFSSVAGGAVAAHRRRSRYLAGAGAGALAGVVAAIPLAVLFVPAVAVAVWLGFGVAPSSPAFEPFLAIVAVLFLGYTVGLSTLGGLLGAWTSANTDWGLDPVDWW